MHYDKPRRALVLPPVPPGGFVNQFVMAPLRRETDGLRERALENVPSV